MLRIVEASKGRNSVLTKSAFHPLVSLSMRLETIGKLSKTKKKENSLKLSTSNSPQEQETWCYQSPGLSSFDFRLSVPLLSAHPIIFKSTSFDLEQREP
nr:hypothetical protein CFP56_40853 [Quercus suber]